MKLVGFEPSIKLEMRFTGLELLHLLYGAKMHYDGACKATALHAGKNGQRNGLLVTTMMQMKEFDWNGNGMSDEAFLAQNLDATADASFTWREVDLLCKITECFNLIVTMIPHRLDDALAFWDNGTATCIMLGLRQALNEARLNLDILHEQEKLRREKFAEAEKNVLSVNAN